MVLNSLPSMQQLFPMLQPKLIFLAELKNIPCEKHCIIFRTSYEQCLKRNELRERKVPPEVIRKMYMSWDTPYYFEGWDEIFIYDNAADFHELCKRRPGDFIKETVMFDQKNPHHSLTLGNHCAQVGNLLKDDTALKYAGMLHDCGKPFCKTYTDSKGNISKVAHYYNHERTGSYNSLFYNTYDDNLYRAALIRWHMQPYYWEKDNNEKLHNKYRKLWGEDLYKEIMLLHTCDRAAH